MLAPDDPKWLHEDAELPLPTQAWVHRARYVGPRGRRLADELHGRSGVDLAVRRASTVGRRLLVPDENVTWNATAIPKAISIARSEGIDVVLTTSPPGSVHLVGAAVQKATGAKWVADLRDSLLAHPHRRSDTLAARVKEQATRGVASLVARRADAIVAAADAIADEARSLNPRGRVVTIENGCDFDDFAGLEYRAVRRLPPHAHGLVLRQARPEAVPARARRLRARGRERALRRRLPARRPGVHDRARARRPGRADRPRAAAALARAPARERGAAPAHPRGRRPRTRRALRQGVRVHRRRAADPRDRAAGRCGRAAHPRHRRRRRRGARRRGRHPRGARRPARAVARRRPRRGRRWRPSGASSCRAAGASSSSPICCGASRDRRRRGASARREPYAGDGFLLLRDILLRHLREGALEHRRKRRDLRHPDDSLPRRLCASEPRTDAAHGGRSSSVSSSPSSSSTCSASSISRRSRRSTST